MRATGRRGAGVPPSEAREPKEVARPPDPFVRQRSATWLDGTLWRHIVTRWAISIASLIGGLAALFVFRRGVPHVGWIVGYIVVLWLLFAVLTQVRARLLAGGRRLVLVAGDYTIQTLYHGLLLFVLPGYLASTTFDGVTLPFFLVLAGAALITTIDPWFRALVHPFPPVARGFFAFALFAGLNVALPLVGVPPAAALLGSAALAGLALMPAFVERAGSWWRAAGLAGLTAAGAAALVWVARPAIPPAPLQLARSTVARAVVDLEPVDVLGARVPARTLAEWGALVAYTPVVAPAGLRQPILHRWRHDGRVVTTVRLPTPVVGGRAAGFRTYSRKADFPADARGRWSVDVVTASGQLIGRVRFTVVP
ncbi:MAG TPA: DUF5924 family protein [Methylomirabilota bacterium]|jgi:hypothetical protein|nr:DUF5924 family protein [Methylomirabilota bacterium]